MNRVIKKDLIGSALFKKDLFGWKLVSSSSGELSNEYKLGWGFSNLVSHFSDYTDLISGKILEEVNVKPKGGNEFKAEIVNYNNDEKFWFLVTSGLVSEIAIFEQSAFLEYGRCIF